MPRAACSGRAKPSLLSFSGSGRGGQPRKGGAPRAAGRRPSRSPRTKGDGDGSSVVKTTCAGCGPRSGCGLGALRLNPFPAASSPLRLAVGDLAGPAGSRLGVGARPLREEAGQDPGNALSWP